MNGFVSPMPSRQSTQHPLFQQPSRGASLFDGLKTASTSSISAESRAKQDLALFGADGNYPYQWNALAGPQTALTEADLLHVTAELSASSSYHQDATQPVIVDEPASMEDGVFPPPWNFLAKSYKEQHPNAQQGQYELLRRDTFLWNSSANPTAWRDPFDDRASNYSSSISRPSSPSLSSYKGTPSISDLDHHIADDLAQQMETDLPLFNSLNRNETVRPSSFDILISSALHQSTIQVPAPAPPSSAHDSPRRTHFLDAEILSQSPDIAPDSAPQYCPSYTVSYSQPDVPAQPIPPQPQRKDSQLARLDIPMDSVPSSEKGTATAGPQTARPGKPHVLEQLLSEAQRVRSWTATSVSLADLAIKRQPDLFEEMPDATEQASNLNAASRPPLVEPYFSNATLAHIHDMPIRRRSHSDAEIPLLHQAQQNAMYQYNQEQQQWDPNLRLPSFAELGASIDTRFTSPSASPASVASLAGAQDEAFNAMFGPQQPSFAGPRRTSDVSEHGRPDWPYAAASDISRPASEYSYQSSPTYPVDQQHAQNSMLFASSSQTMPAYSQAIDQNGSFAFGNAMLGDHQMPYVPRYGDGSNSFAYTDGIPSDTNYYAYPQDYGQLQALPQGSSSGCPSPSLSNVSYEPRRFNSAGIEDGGDVIDNPLHRESQTTSATKQAAAARRKPGTDAKYTCEYCGESFTRNYNLRGHLRAHNGVKPFACTEPGCTKSFARAHDLKRHSALHTTVSKYKCLSCQKAFKRLDALQRHHRSEAGQQCVAKLCEAGEFNPQRNGLVRVTPINQGVAL